MSSLFAAGDLLLARVGAVSGIASAVYGSRIVGPNSNAVVMPAAFVVPDEAAGMEGVAGSDKVHERQQWVIGVRAELDPNATAANSAETRLGTLVIAIIKAVSITNTGDGLKHVRYVKRTPVQYPEASGYAEVWLTFDLVAQIT